MLAGVSKRFEPAFSQAERPRDRHRLITYLGRLIRTLPRQPWTTNNHSDIFFGLITVEHYSATHIIAHLPPYR
jgi:hypothetical protein